MTTETRNAALNQVEKKTWSDSAISLFDGIALQLPCTFTGEDLRLLLTDSGLGQPHHHNAWGALIMKLARTERIVGTDEYRNMKTKKSHARRTRVYARPQSC